ncbi:MAG: hypothetical protein FWD60_03155 [Candidatus Azobacteroides sp.]|nr:hypothetical protein [Candidatus Azobacteroides sp.]
MRLTKIKLKELEKFCESQQFKNFTIKPITPLRVKSYLANPRANQEDIVLYMLFENENLIGFRTLLSDVCFQGDTPFKFAWFSGNWISPEYRGKKLSTYILKECMVDWKEKLMFTNYADVSLNLYSGTQLFSSLRKRTGLRFYLYPDFIDIYKSRINNSLLKIPLFFLSCITYCISFTKSILYKFVNKDIKYTELDMPDNDCWNYLEKYRDTLFNRKRDELEWIFKYHWVTKEPEENYIYPFSYSDITYTLKAVKIYKNDTSFSGFFIYSIVNSKMKILFYYLAESDLYLMTDIIPSIALKNKISCLTILDNKIASIVKKRCKCFAFSKSYSSHIFSSFGDWEENNKITFDGDGDNCFT